MKTKILLITIPFLITACAGAVKIGDFAKDVEYLGVNPGLHPKAKSIGKVTGDSCKTSFGWLQFSKPSVPEAMEDLKDQGLAYVKHVNIEAGSRHRTYVLFGRDCITIQGEGYR